MLKLTAFRAVVTVIFVDLVLTAIAWLIGWPVISGLTLFLLGLATMVIAYLAEASLFARYRFERRIESAVYDRAWKYKLRSRGRPRESSSKQKTGFAPEADEATRLTESEINNARKLSELLITVSLSGAIAMVLSFLLPRLF